MSWGEDRAYCCPKRYGNYFLFYQGWASTTRWSLSWRTKTRAGSSRSWREFWRYVLLNICIRIRSVRSGIIISGSDMTRKISSVVDPDQFLVIKMRSGSGSVLVSNGKLWIRIRKKWIRIHNTDNKKLRCLHFEFFMTIYVRYGSGCVSRTNWSGSFYFRQRKIIEKKSWITRKTVHKFLSCWKDTDPVPYL